MCVPVSSTVEKDWVHNGIQCTYVTGYMGFYCGYVRCDPGHPWHGKDYNDIDADIHGGLTFAALEEEECKHEDGLGWWIGFDCGHYNDFIPGRAGIGMFSHGTVWTPEMIQKECEKLADRVKEAEEKHALCI